MSTVLIACKLPHGIRLDDARNPLDETKRVVIRGLRNTKTKLLMSVKSRTEAGLFDYENYATTEVDAEFWKRWVETAGKSCTPFLKGMFWEAKTEKDAAAQANDTGKTGFEQIDPTKIKQTTGINVSVPERG